MDLVDIGTGRVAYDSVGEGPAVLLGHSSLVDRRKCARYMAVGPGRTPEVFEPDAWRFVLEMTGGVFARLWRDPASEEVDPEPPLLPRLADVEAPTLVVSGAADVTYVQDVSKLLASGIPGARQLELHGTAHLPPVERPSDVNAALLEFLGTLPLATSQSIGRA